MARAYCIIPKKANEYLKQVRQGKVDYRQVMLMSRANRIKHLSSHFGESDAKNINRLIETRLLAQKQQAALKRYIKSSIKVSKKTRESLEQRVSQMVREGAVDSTTIKGVIERTVEGVLGNHITAGQQMRLRRAVDKVLKYSVGDLKSIEMNRAKRTAYGLAQINLARTRVEVIKENTRLKAGDVAKAALELPRGLVFSLDHSAVFTQALGRFGSPTWFKAVAKSFGSMSEKSFLMNQAYMITDPLYEKAVKANLNIYNLSGNVNQQVSQELGDVASKLPIIGKGMAVSSRLYATMLNETRFNTFSAYYRMEAAAGHDVSLGSKNLADLADRINIATQGVRLNDKNKFVAGLTTLMSSASRQVALLKTPKLLLSTDPIKLRLGLTTVFSYMGFIASAYGLAKFLSAIMGWEEPKIESDTRSKNFGRMYVAGRWITLNPLAGYTSLMTRIIMGEQLDSNKHIIRELDANLLTRAGKETNNFFANLIQPLFSPIYNAMFRENKDYMGREQELDLDLAARLTIPTWGQEIAMASLQDGKLNVDLIDTAFSALGINSYSFEFSKDWQEQTTQEIIQFRTKLGEEKLKQFDYDFNKQYHQLMMSKVREQKYLDSTDEEKTKTLNKIGTDLKKRLFKKYGFKKMNHEKFLKKYPDVR